MERNYDGLCCSEGGSLRPGSGNEGKREIVLNRRPELERENIDAFNQKIILLKDVLMPVKHNVFLWNLPGCRRGAFT
ncbi:hypothetical protein TNCV_4047311 [Trichonephila clavipes]|nr:hypothetical protein TNCV_4047311 [Trichonephila clavipes]